MAIETLKRDNKKSVAEKLNRALQVEYDLIFNYPRVIDKLVNIEKIHDERLNSMIEVLGIESLRHFTEVDNLIVKLGGETQWSFEVIDRLVDVEEILAKQLEREKWVVSWYTSAKRIAEQNKVKAGGVLGKLTGSPGVLPEDFIDANEIINTLDRIIRDEKRHALLVQNSINTLKRLTNK